MTAQPNEELKPFKVSFNDDTEMSEVHGPWPDGIYYDFESMGEAEKVCQIANELHEAWNRRAQEAPQGERKPKTENFYQNGACLSVKELKRIIANWPETDHLGDDSEVWVETGINLSSPVVRVFQLNQCDIILESNAFAADKAEADRTVGRRSDR